MILLSEGLSTLLACGEEPAPANAAPHLVGLKDVTQGSLLFKTAEPGHFAPAPVLHTDVQITVTGTIVRAKLKQEFINPAHGKDTWAEGIYVFPLPDTAAVDHLRMTVGERTIEGQIKERTEAKQVYERAKEEGKRASLVEQERPNIFTTSVANIAPGDHITVEIEYQETVRYDQGTYSIRFPMVVGPRYIPGTPVIMEDQPPGPGWSFDTDRVADASRITPPVTRSEHPINPVSLSIDLAPGFPPAAIESPSHSILVVAEPGGRRQISFRVEQVPADRDFVLTWRAAGEQSPVATVFTQRHGEEVYALVMLTPPARQDQPQAVQPNQPREVIFVIDTSGSMAGTSIGQAKAALLLALTRLTAQDRFNVIQFNSVTHVLFSQAQPVTTATIRKAVHYVERLHANGGTEILPALKTALKGTAPASHLRQVIFLTDGQVGNEDELFGVIREHLGASRLYTIGIGSAPNSHFMRKAAEFGRGTFISVGSTTDVKAQMDAMLRKLERPVLTDITVEGLDGADELFPARVPDLYEGEPVVLALKSKHLPAALTVRASLGRIPWTSTLALKEAPAREGLAVHWARRKIDSLMDQQQYGREDPSIRQAILDVSLAHHLVSKYTSLVAVDHEPIRPTDKAVASHMMKTNLPAGQDYQAIFGLPRTATPAQMQIVFGAACLALGWLTWRLCRQAA
jgi:Ca-activated chloride channel family protein